MSVRVYVFETKSLNSKRLSNSRVKERVKTLQEDFHEQYGLEYKLKGSYRKRYIRFIIKDAKERSEILFYFRTATNGIYFQEILLPRQQRLKGIGSFFVSWLKAFCQDFGIKYIVLGSRTEAEVFWDKMGFSTVTYDEALEKYPWMDPVPTCFKL